MTSPLVFDLHPNSPIACLQTSFLFSTKLIASVRTRDGNEDKAEREKRQKADLSENYTVIYSQKAVN